MKNKRIEIGFWLFTCLFIVSLFSCEKVIELPLKSSEPLLVIEGNIDDQGFRSEVLLSQTVPFSSLGEKLPVSGAVVNLQEDNNGPMLLEEEEEGRYTLKGFKGKPGSTYYLSVTVHGKEYQAYSEMPIPVELDSVGTISTTVFSETIKSAGVIYHDPINIKNYYRFKMRINHVGNSSFWVFNDRFTDGNAVTQTLNDLSNKIHEGDLVTIEMQCIDSAVYHYWNTLSNQSLGAAVPSNPVSNISNGALGYFSAHTISRTDFQVK